MVIAEPWQRNDTLHIRSMHAIDECTHGRYLVIAVAEHLTIIITRACVVIRIDQSPMPECRISQTSGNNMNSRWGIKKQKSKIF